MNDNGSTAAPSREGYVIEIEREFPASRELVFRRWTDADALARWFAPPGYSTVNAEADPRPGGEWRLDFRADSGEHSYTEQGRFREIEPFDRLSLTLTQVDGGHSNPETVVSVVLSEIGASADGPLTRMRFTQSGFTSLGLRNDNEDGWQGCFDSLGGDLGSVGDLDGGDGGAAAREAGATAREAALERELRELFEEWFEASARKDLDAQMTPIADDILSYEHETPQQYRGVEAIRQVCAAGLEYQDGDFRWDIPDLQIRISGDVAVTWGLNRMRNFSPDGSVREEWSRGTRVFEHREGRWQMIHQHVSFPVDGEGRASAAL